MSQKNTGDKNSNKIDRWNLCKPNRTNAKKMVELYFSSSITEKERSSLEEIILGRFDEWNKDGINLLNERFKIFFSDLSYRWVKYKQKLPLGSGKFLGKLSSLIKKEILSTKHTSFSSDNWLETLFPGTELDDFFDSALEYTLEDPSVRVKEVLHYINGLRDTNGNGLKFLNRLLEKINEKKAISSFSNTEAILFFVLLIKRTLELSLSAISQPSLVVLGATLTAKDILLKRAEELANTTVATLDYFLGSTGVCFLSEIMDFQRFLQKEKSRFKTGFKSLEAWNTKKEKANDMFVSSYPVSHDFVPGPFNFDEIEISELDKIFKCFLKEREQNETFRLPTYIKKSSDIFDAERVLVHLTGIINTSVVFSARYQIKENPLLIEKLIPVLTQHFKPDSQPLHILYMLTRELLTDPSPDCLDYGSLSPLFSAFSKSDNPDAAILIVEELVKRLKEKTFVEDKLKFSILQQYIDEKNKGIRFLLEKIGFKDYRPSLSTLEENQEFSRIKKMLVEKGSVNQISFVSMQILSEYKDCDKDLMNRHLELLSENLNKAIKTVHKHKTKDSFLSDKDSFKDLEKQVFLAFVMFSKHMTEEQQKDLLTGFLEYSCLSRSLKEEFNKDSFVYSFSDTVYNILNSSYLYPSVRDLLIEQTMQEPTITKGLFEQEFLDSEENTITKGIMITDILYCYLKTFASSDSFQKDRFIYRDRGFERGFYSFGFPRDQLLKVLEFRLTDNMNLEIFDKHIPKTVMSISKNSRSSSELLYIYRVLSYISNSDEFSKREKEKAGKFLSKWKKEVYPHMIKNISRDDVASFSCFTDLFETVESKISFLNDVIVSEDNQFNAIDMSQKLREIDKRLENSKTMKTLEALMGTLEAKLKTDRFNTMYSMFLMLFADKIPIKTKQAIAEDISSCRFRLIKRFTADCSTSNNSWSIMSFISAVNFLSANKTPVRFENSFAEIILRKINDMIKSDPDLNSANTNKIFSFLAKSGKGLLQFKETEKSPFFKDEERELYGLIGKLSGSKDILKETETETYENLDIHIF